MTHDDNVIDICTECVLDNINNIKRDNMKYLFM